MKALVLAGLLFLASCATKSAEPVYITKTVQVPVAVSCVPPGLPPAPSYSDTAAALKAAAGPDQRYHLLSSEWPRRDARLAVLEGVVNACR